MRLFPSPVKNVSVTDLALSADHPDYRMLFRQHVSRPAAGKARALLEGVRLDEDTIAACSSAHPKNDEEIVQDGLIRWTGGKGRQPPTWGVLLDAMEYANIAQQHARHLREKLGI